MMTHTQFSMQASFLSSEASKWAADVLTLPEEHDKSISDWAMERFLNNMRERLDRIEKWHKERPPSPNQIPNINERGRE